MTERMITDAELAEREKARFEWMAAHSREFQIKGYSETCGEEERDHLFTIWMTGELSLLDRLRNAERLLREALTYLVPGGLLFMEVGQGQAPVVRRIAARLGGYAPLRIVEDAAGIERVVIAQRLG